MASLGKSPASPREVEVYHCVCTHLFLASTQPLQSLPTRRTSDKAYILRLPPQPPRESHASEYAILLGANLDRSPVIIRGDDGFEKRYLQRCGRCKLTVGYQLDKSQYEGEEEQGRREDIVYLLPGGLMTTEEMASGKDMSSEIVIDR